MRLETESHSWCHRANAFRPEQTMARAISEKDTARLKRQILENSTEIVRLKARIKETLRERTKTPAKRAEWEQACAEFHQRYAGLAFPGGYDGALERILAGDPETTEAAVCFLECRPYFFRSGYMFKDILRKCRRAPLSPQQAARLKAMEQKLADWREGKLARKKQISRKN
jgi:hypothetical protein